MTNNTTEPWGAPGTKVLKVVPSDAEIIEIGKKLDEFGLAVALQQPDQRDASDKEYVANNINRLRHLDLKSMVEEMFGDTMPKDKFEAMDKMAEWSAANVFPKSP